MGFNLLMLMSFEIATVTTMDLKSQSAVRIAWLLNEVSANMQLPYKAHFGGIKFGRGWGQLMYGSLTFLCAASWPSKAAVQSDKCLLM